MRTSFTNEASPAQLQEISLLKGELREIKDTLLYLVQNQQNNKDFDPNMNQQFNHSSSQQQMRSSYQPTQVQSGYSPQKNSNMRESDIYQNERESLIEAKTQQQNRLKLVEELDKQYTTKLESAYKNEFQNEIESALDVKTLDQYEKMTKLVNDLQTDNYRLKKEFEMYRENKDQKETLENTKNQLVDMKISKLLQEFIEKYHDNPAFHDVMTDTEYVQTIWKENNLREMFMLFLTFTQHGTFNKKPVAKKEGKK